jgi:hypothetical protein
MDTSLPSPRRVPAWSVSVFVTALALWTGAAAFFSGGVLPILFLNLETSEAGRIAAMLFPAYFRAGLVAGVIATLAAAWIARLAGRRWVAVAGLLAAMTLAQGWSALVVHPQMAVIRGVAGEEARFQQLHKLSVRLNSVVLVGGALILAATGVLLAARRDDA